MPVVQRAEIDPAAKDLLRPHLKAGEALAWAGFPDKARFGRGSWIMFAFAIPWTAFALFWEGGVLMTAEGPIRLFMGLFGLPFVGIGLFMLAAPFKARQVGARLVYGATSDRLLIGLAGKPGTLRSYGPADLAALHRENEKDGLSDIYFAVDQDVAAVMPAATGKGGGTLGKVGFIGVPVAAWRAVEAVHQRRVPGTPAPAIGPAQEGTNLTARGTFETCLVKLQAQLTERRAAQARKALSWHNRFWLVAATALVAPPAIGFASAGVTGALFALVACSMVAIFLAIGRYAMNAHLTKEDEAVKRFEAVRVLLAGWQADDHPKGRLAIALDFGPASGVRPYRFANSASSGSLKTYHRHRWARFVWATACGSPLVVELVDKVKYKAGAEVERHPLVRGWLVPNEAVWGDALDQPFRAGPLQVMSLQIEGRRVLGFRGEVKDASEVGAAIAALYRALAKARRSRG